MLIGALIMLMWVISIASCILYGIMVCSPILCLIGILLVVVPFIVGGYYNSTTPKGRIQKRREYNKQKKIEKEFGIIEYWEDK